MYGVFRSGWSHDCRSVTHPGGTPLYKLYRYVPPQMVWFLRRLGLITEMYGRICRFNSKIDE